MADALDSSYSAVGTDDPWSMLKGIVSPASAHQLVGPPPDAPPQHQPGQSTPLTGTLATAPSQAVAKNRDTGTGYNVPLQGVSRPPNGGVVDSIASPVQENQ